MFRWYRDAERCYVYLADVSSSSEHGQEGSTRLWETAFRESRWFTRGWTLQELIAPKKVDFYSKEGHWLGDKRSLESIICDVTGIPASALRGTPLHQFSEAERESWLQNRQTRYEEDLAYSLLGIFDVFLPLIYGEGFQNAKRRLREEVQKVKELKARHNIGASVQLDLIEMSQTQPFVARDRESAEMHDVLASDIAHNIVVLHGAGGIGKTELAVAFIKKCRYDRRDVFWVDFKDAEAVQRSFTNIARQILQQDPDTGYLSALDLQHEQDEKMTRMLSAL
ncbi:hypothetical protein KJ359_008457 [Pestalotiopsis sp. 9143b]|nr:hypothetical protein KJ359_008457 [Pestalotiopsis sp. 9143b]